MYDSFPTLQSFPLYLIPTVLKAYPTRRFFFFPLKKLNSFLQIQISMFIEFTYFVCLALMFGSCPIVAILPNLNSIPPKIINGGAERVS